jgi:uncharacterized membrane protein YtjA (UPF0391 family)
MLRTAFFFLLLAVVSGVLGFTTIAGASWWIAKVLFFIFIAMWIILLAVAWSMAKNL